MYEYAWPRGSGTIDVQKLLALNSHQHMESTQRLCQNLCKIGLVAATTDACDHTIPAICAPQDDKPFLAVIMKAAPRQRRNDLLQVLVSVIADCMEGESTCCGTRLPSETLTAMHSCVPTAALGVLWICRTAPSASAAARGEFLFACESFFVCE